MKPGGKLVLGFEDKDKLENKPLSAEIFRLYAEDEVRNLLMDAGFGGVEIHSKAGKSNLLHCSVAMK